MSFEVVRDGLYAQIDDAYEVAKHIQNEWMKSIAKRELSRRDDVSRKTEKTNYEFRLEIKGISFSCRWLRIQFVKNGNRTIRLARSVPMPKNGIHQAKDFKFADDWELELIMKMESVLKEIRVSVKHLGKSHFYLIHASKSYGTPINSLSMISRVQKSNTSIKKYKSLYISS